MKLRKALNLPSDAVQQLLTEWRKQYQFRKEYKAFRELSATYGTGKRFELRWKDRYPCVEDRTATTDFDRHYIYHTAWAARVLAQSRPSEHVDLGSTLYFCGIISAFVAVRFYDYRPPDLRLPGLTSASADLLRLPFADGSIRSLSCMHVVEHVGLGRYGDPLDPEGDHKAMSELQRVLAPSGSLLFVVPVGRPRICFNAHRIYSLSQVGKAFCELDLKEFALVPDDPADGGLINNPAEAFVDSQNYSCGCFWFVKPAQKRRGSRIPTQTVIDTKLDR